MSMRQGSRINFYYWSQDHKIPLRFFSRYFLDQLNIKTLIYYSKKTKSRKRNIFRNGEDSDLVICPAGGFVESR